MLVKRALSLREYVRVIQLPPPLRGFYNHGPSPWDRRGIAARAMRQRVRHASQQQRLPDTAR